MDLWKDPERVVASVADFRQSLIRKITDQTLGDPAQESGISPSAGRKRKLMVERAKKIAAALDDALVPTGRVRKLEEEIERLKRLLEKQAVVLRVLEKNGML